MGPSQVLDPDFLDAVCNDSQALERARSAMRGLGGVPFGEAYAKARARLGM